MDIQKNIKSAQKLLGIKRLRRHQIQPINSILAGDDTMVIAPTSAGKSAINQVPALIFPGLTLVIEPTLSLMYDQVNKLKAHGIKAAHIDSTVPAYERNRILKRIKKDKIKILFITPERLQNQIFLKAIEDITPAKKDRKAEGGEKKRRHGMDDAAIFARKTASCGKCPQSYRATAQNEQNASRHDSNIHPDCIREHRRAEKTARFSKWSMPLCGHHLNKYRHHRYGRNAK